MVTNYVASQLFDHYNTLQLLCKQECDADTTIRTKVLLGEEDLVLLTKKVGKTSYTRRKIDTFGELLDFDFNVTWLPITTIPLMIPPKGRKFNDKRNKMSSSDSLHEKQSKKKQSLMRTQATRRVTIQKRRRMISRSEKQPLRMSPIRTRTSSRSWSRETR